MDDAYRFAPAAPGERYVYGAASPGWHTTADHETAIDAWIDFMTEQGIERVCCLLAGRGPDGCEKNLNRYVSAFGDENVMHAPLPDNRELVDRDVLKEQIMPFLVDSVRTETPVVVHGLAGLGRTGQVLAAWLVFGRGYTPRVAIRNVHEMGRFPEEPAVTGNASAKALETRLAVIE